MWVHLSGSLQSVFGTQTGEEEGEVILCPYEAQILNVSRLRF